MKKTISSLWVLATTAFLTATSPASAGDTYVAPSVELKKLCAATQGKSGVIIGKKDLCEISTDGGNTWSAVATWAGWTLLVGLLACGGVLLRRRKIEQGIQSRKEAQEAEEIAVAKKLAELHTTNPPQDASYKEVSRVIGNVFWEKIEGMIKFFYKESIRIKFPHGGIPIEIVVRGDGRVWFFRNDQGYDKVGVWQGKSAQNIPVSFAEEILTSLKNGETHPPAFTDNPPVFDMWTFDAELDPLAEANVYIAYGRPAQAESILIKALETDPENIWIHLKLAEIYGWRGDRDEFYGAKETIRLITQETWQSWETLLNLEKQFFAQDTLRTPLQPTWLGNDSGDSAPFTLSHPESRIAELRDILAREDTSPEGRWEAAIEMLQIMTSDSSIHQDPENILLYAQYLKDRIRTGEAVIDSTWQWALDAIIGAIGSEKFQSLLTPEQQERAKQLLSASL